MPGTPTTKYAIPTLAGADLARDIDTNVNSSLTSIDSKMVGYSAGLLAARPTSTGGSPGVAGRRYRATDTGQEFIDTGTSWIEIASSPVQVEQIADGAVTSRKLKPTIVVAENAAASQSAGAEADVTGSVLNVTPLVTSTVVVQGTVHVAVAASGQGALRVRQDAANDSMVQEVFTAFGSGSINVTVPILAVFTGVTAAAHTYRLRLNGSGCTLTRFRLMATVFAQ